MDIHTELEILNQDSNPVLLGVDPWINEVFSLSWSSPVEKKWNLCKKKVKRGRRMKNGWEKKREKIFILKLAQQVTKYVFVQNEVTN